MMKQTEATEQASLLNRSDGVTDAERYLTRLARNSFLSLWSYPNLHRDESLVKKRGTKCEICDLLVVFENHLIIFSDKDCAFQDRGDLNVDWSRWYRGAVLENAKQVWGAEKWIISHPENIFLDKDCTQPFPISLPSADVVKVHRIVVAHSAADRCRRELGGSGSLKVMPGIVGNQHCLKRADGGIPFAIGQIDPTRGYVHVLDDTTLNIVLTTLDTISDFVAYLDKKERVITSGKLEAAPGEEDLLALYLQKMNEDDEHDFIIPPNKSSFSLEEGSWEKFETNPQRKAQIAANKVSYAWDGLIETFLYHIYAGTSYSTSPHSLAEKERGYRLMAREPRTRRRFLAGALLDLILTSAILRATKTILPSRAGDPHYIFLVLLHPPDISYKDYRAARVNHLEQCCMIAKASFPDAQDIIGIATESGRTEAGSEDMLYFDAREWSPAEQAHAEQMREEFLQAGIIGESTVHQRREKEYPDLPEDLCQSQRRTYIPAVKGRDRNAPCPCGSGKKYKKCHGA